MNTVAPESAERVEPSAPTTKAESTIVRRGGWRSSDTLGIAWLHGLFHVAVFRRHTMGPLWEAPTAVTSLEEFETTLDTALAATSFNGTDVFIILEHDEFLHQAELAPAFSETAARNFLRGRVVRHETEHAPVLWVSQRTVSVRQESAFLLHMLPANFYGRLNSVLHARRLDLTRILPLIVPLQLTLGSGTKQKDQPVLLAAEAGAATTIMVARGDGQLLFARTMSARWSSDTARIGVEVNRSLLYAKQQFSTVVDQVILLGGANETVRTDVQGKCGGKNVVVASTTVADWLGAVARLSSRHPVNLVAGHLGRKRRHQFYRRALLAACWLSCSLLALDGWARWRDLNEDQIRLRNLRAAEPAMLAQRAQLTQRNETVARARELIRQAADERLPDVSARFLTYLGTVRPPSIQFTEIGTKWDPSTRRWTFRLEGQIEGDEETAREELIAFQKLLSRSPLAARFNDAVRSLAVIPTTKSDLPSGYRFGVEGGLFEN